MAAEPEDIAGVDGDETDMVSKVAGAICKAADFRPICSMCPPPPGRPNDGCLGSRYKREAKAAIAAHEAALEEQGLVIVPREPTEAMAAAWCKLSLERIRRAVESDKPRPGVGMIEGAKESYKAMLAALEEKE